MKITQHDFKKSYADSINKSREEVYYFVFTISLCISIFGPNGGVALFKDILVLVAIPCGVHIFLNVINLHVG